MGVRSDPKCDMDSHMVVQVKGFLPTRLEWYISRGIWKISAEALAVQRGLP